MAQIVPEVDPHSEGCQCHRCDDARDALMPRAKDRVSCDCEIVQARRGEWYFKRFVGECDHLSRRNSLTNPPTKSEKSRKQLRPSK